MSRQLVVGRTKQGPLQYLFDAQRQLPPEGRKPRRERTDVIVDPTPFTSSKRLYDLAKSLPVFGSSLQTETTLILPSLLLQELQSLTNDRTFRNLPQIIKKWLPYSYSDDHIRLLCIGLSTDEEYLEALKEFLSTYKPIPASRFVAQYDKLGEATIFRRELRRRMGEAAGEVLFEILAVAREIGGLIVSFGEMTHRLAARAGERILKVPSELKDNVKRKAEIRRALRIAGYVLSLESFHELVASLGLHVPITSDVGVGLLLIADG